MKNLYKILITLGTVGFSITANSATFNFGGIANGNEYGAKSISFNDNGLSVVATGWSGNELPQAEPDYFAYLDAGNAGLGVCQNLNNNNQCTPSSDDNVTYGETLRLTFDYEVSIDEIVFVNGNHGTNFTDDFIFTIDGISQTHALTNSFGTSLIMIGTVFEFYNPNIGGGGNVSNDKQFYINTLTTGSRGLNPPEVPVPAAIWLFGSGLVGLVAIARRKTHI